MPPPITFKICDFSFISLKNSKPHNIDMKRDVWVKGKPTANPKFNIA